MKNPGQRNLLKPTLVFNGAGLAFLTSIAFVVGAPWWFLFLLAIAMLVVANLLWVLAFMLLAVRVLFRTGVIRGMLNRVLNRSGELSQPAARTPEMEQKLTQAMRWSSFPFVAIPIMCLLGVALLDAVTAKSVSALYLICLSHCCVGLIGWLLALRETIAPLPLGIGDGFDVW
jgi:hypothetical protein